MSFFPEYRSRLFFQDGGLIFAKTNEPEERLGVILFKMGKSSKRPKTPFPH